MDQSSAPLGRPESVMNDRLSAVMFDDMEGEIYDIYFQFVYIYYYNYFFFSQVYDIFFELDAMIL
eukprot:9125698-Heterocapsa_arctica.AAC.1